MKARIDLDAIETAAGDLGLTKPSQEQIVYLDLSGADRAEIYQEEKTSVFSRDRLRDGAERFRPDRISAYRLCISWRQDAQQ